MEKRSKTEVTELSSHDRKILAKYSGYHSNFIESNTAKNDVLPEDNFKGKG